jgi:hypothetical protein
MKPLKALTLFICLVMAGLGCSHAQPQAPARQIYVISDDALGIGGSGGRDCDQEHIDCFENCWNATERPYPFVERDEWYYKYCTKKCREAYMECIKETEKATKEPSKLTFTSMDFALDWLRKHKTELVMGTVVVIAGVTFVIATGGSGALLLVPVAL